MLCTDKHWQNNYYITFKTDSMQCYQCGLYACITAHYVLAATDDYYNHNYFALTFKTVSNATYYYYSLLSMIIYNYSLFGYCSTLQLIASLFIQHNIGLYDNCSLVFCLAVDLLLQILHYGYPNSTGEEGQSNDKLHIVPTEAFGRSA